MTVTAPTFTMTDYESTICKPEPFLVSHLSSFIMSTLFTLLILAKHSAVFLENEKQRAILLFLFLASE